MAFTTMAAEPRRVHHHRETPPLRGRPRSVEHDPQTSLNPETASKGGFCG